ncbi:hypothetical protein MHBO_003755 [Bonamia ostreae]|uniref:ubiquitinyl hydrolase 1 n=1 Tax=Bonamia ostreae TaxID=126728 RepID=A0ABV2ARG4_9EUKA
MTAKNKNKRPTGLPNLGNSCYLNSVVQSLRTLKTFKIYLSSCKISKNNLLEKKLIDQLKKLLIEPSKSQINGLFAILAKRSFFSPFVQEDAHEFLSFVLSLFPENNPFVGKLVHCNYCRQCDYYSDFRQEIFQSISLDMSFNSVFSGYKGTLFNHNDDSICEPNLRDLLQNYFKGGISDFSCKNCLSKNKIKEFEFDLFEMVIKICLNIAH